MILMDILYKKLLFIIAFAFISQTIIAQEKLTKKIEKSFAMNNAGELHIENKYGEISINGWDENTLQIVMNIEVTHRKKENAKKLLDRISPKITKMGDYVKIQTQITDKSTGFFAKYFEKANPFDYDKSNIKINYEVYLPKKAEIELKNSFGDVLISDWAGKFKGNIQYGDLWVNEDLNTMDIELKHGKLRGKSINYATVRVKNGSINIESSKDLRINSSGSEINLEKINSLEIYSSKDEIDIVQTGTITGDLKFTTIQIDNLIKEMNLTLKISDLKVNSIEEPDTSIILDQESSKVSINITNMGLRFDATLEEGLLRLPKTFKNVKSKLLDSGKRIRKISAMYGKNNKGKISITGKKGAVLLKEL